MTTDKLPEITGVEALNSFKETMVAVMGNQMFASELEDALYHKAVILKIESVIRSAKKKADQDLQTFRQIKGEDYLKGVSTFRKPKEKAEDKNPLSEFMDSEDE